MTTAIHDQLAERLAANPFVPFAIEVNDGRRIVVKTAGDAVLNSLAISVVEKPFVVTVVGLPQVTEITEA